MGNGFQLFKNSLWQQPGRRWNLGGQKHYRLQRFSRLFLAFLCIIPVFCFLELDVNGAQRDLRVEIEIQTKSPASVQDSYSFPISESDLRDLAHALAPKVDLFREVWEKDPEAEFFAGTTRDYLYWILGHFKGLENLDPSTKGQNLDSSAAGAKQSDVRREKVEAIKAKLLDTPFIKFNEIVGPESDADIMTKNRDVLSALRAQDFAIRKLDFISFDRALPGQKMYQDEINQGYIPSEKIRLSKNGIVIDPNFGNGVADLISGNISIQFPDMKKFWKTHYANQGANHPLLLALRYVRILAQDYLQRHGSEIPDHKKLESPMTLQIKEKIKSLIQEAIANTDGSFKKFLKNKQGRKWLNASIQKSFRSFTNANAAFELMKELGLLGLIEVYPDQIESVHQYLLKAERNENEISENFKKFGVTHDQLYQNISDYLPNLELYHGTASELAFRNIIYQGVIPSDSGSADRGLYGVSKRDLEFAKKWSHNKSRQMDLVIALKLKPSTRIVDITKGVGKELFERWKDSKNKEKQKGTNNTYPHSSLTVSSASKAQDQNLYDAFSKDFGIDLLRYPYTDENSQSIEAFVLKSSQAIESRRGVFKNPRPLSELLSEAIIAKDKNDLYFLKDFLATPLTKDERKKILTILGDLYFDKAFEEKNFQTLKKILNPKIVSFLDYLLQSPLTSVHTLVWKRVPSLLKDSSEHVRYDMTFALQMLSTWPTSFWDEVPSLIRDQDNVVRKNMLSSIQTQYTWPVLFWSEVPALLKESKELLTANMFDTLQSQKIWPLSFWNRLPELLRDIDDPFKRRLWKAVCSQKVWPPSFWNEVPTLLKDSKELLTFNTLISLVQIDAFEVLHNLKIWPLSFWNKLPELLRDSDDAFRKLLWKAVCSQKVWPPSFWNEVPTLLQDSSDRVRLSAAWSLRTEKDWPESVWNIIPSLLKDPNTFFVTAGSLQYQNSWPTLVWNTILSSIRNAPPDTRATLAEAVKTQNKWPVRFWKELPELMKDSNQNVRAKWIEALSRQTAWTQDIIDIVESELYLGPIKLGVPVLDLDSCVDSISAISIDPSQEKERKQKNP